MKKRSFVKLVVVVFLLKALIAALFSSDYPDRLFIPFINHFLNHPGNAWQAVFELGWPAELPSPFPYPVGMLALMSVPVGIYNLLDIESIFINNLLFKIPTLAADALIFFFLIKLFPHKRIIFFLLYLCSPIILYACYMHSQLDLIPTAILFTSVYLLIHNRLSASALFFGLSIIVKSHTIAALPLLLIYIFRNHDIKKSIRYFVLVLLIYIPGTLPFIFSDGYREFVVNNEQQNKIFQVFFQIGNSRIYLPVAAMLIIYSRFFAYPKINRDLLFGFMGTLFSIFVLLIIPAPAWYVWMLPFLTIFLAKIHEKQPNVTILYIAFSMAYLIYFILFHSSEIYDLNFLGTPIVINIENNIWNNLVYTGLAVLLFALILAEYRFGIRSNSIYQPRHASVIGIAGDSSAGKSTLLKDIKSILPNEHTVELEGDAEHKWERGDKNWQSYSHLHPKANHLYRQADHITSLKSGTSILRSDYDHKTGKFTRPEKVSPRDFIILAGLHSFFLPIQRRAIDLKIYMDPDENLRRRWKIERDMQKRNYSEADVVKQIESRQADARKFIYPQKDYADLIIQYTEENGLLNTRLIFDINLNIEEPLQKFQEMGIAIPHDFDNKIKHQFLVLNQNIPADKISIVASATIENLHELVDPQSLNFQDDQRGITQLLILLMLQEIWRGSKIHA